MKGGFITYPGGKGLIINRLLPHIPAHNIFGEVCGGGAAMLLAKQPSPLDIYNDVDSGLYNLFKVVSDADKFDKLRRKIILTPFSRAVYLECRDNWHTYADEIDRAWAFYVICRQGHASRMVAKSGWSYSKRVSGSRAESLDAWLSAVERLPEIYTRLTTVQVDCLDFFDFMPRYDTPDTFYYIDPPYYGIDDIYASNFTHGDHLDLLDLLLGGGLNSKIMLSGYRCTPYTVLDEAGWRSLDFNHYSQGSVNKTNTDAARRVETIWMNYEAPV